MQDLPLKWVANSPSRLEVIFFNLKMHNPPQVRKDSCDLKPEGILVGFRQKMDSWTICDVVVFLHCLGKQNMSLLIGGINLFWNATSRRWHNFTNSFVSNWFQMKMQHANVSGWPHPESELSVQARASLGDQSPKPVDHCKNPNQSLVRGGGGLRPHLNNSILGIDQ